MNEISTRDLFYIPKGINGSDVTYLCGNSLGLQPKSVRSFIQTELDDWAKLGVEGHFKAQNPWLDYHKLLTGPMAKIVGALPHEVVIMNTLTVNLHLLMASFYKPKGKKYKVLVESRTFSSDLYAIETQAQWHGFDPKTAVIEVRSDSKNGYITTEEFCEALNTHQDEIALVLLGGVNFYTGQFFDLEKITACAHRLGILVGVDLAHAAGNVSLHLHNWGVDFAAWCSYKYLNAGPGGPSGIFVHEKHGLNSGTFRLGGWWGHNAQSRFQMESGFIPQKGAEGWQISNAQIMAFAPLRASLEIFESVGMEALLAKSKLLQIQLLAGLVKLKEEFNHSFSLLSPESIHEHGCQVSISIPGRAKDVADFLQSKDIITDYRQPDVLRVSPVPLYNTKDDVDRFLVGFSDWLSNNHT